MVLSPYYIIPRYILEYMNLTDLGVWANQLQTATETSSLLLHHLYSLNQFSFKMGAEGNVGAMEHIFAPIQGPQIHYISREAVQEFLAERKAYEGAIDAQLGISKVSYRSCFQASYLRSLVCIRVFGQNINEESDLSDEILKAKLQELTGGARKASSEQDLADLKRNVKLDAGETYSKLLVLMLSASYIELCDKRGWKFIENCQKTALKHIISVLQPPKLNTHVEYAL